jgi:hypothetical protein
MNMSEEDVQQKLRDLFSDERLGAQSTLNPETIVAGAQRRRRRRHLVQTTTGMAAAVIMLGGGLAVFSIHDKDNGAVISADQLSLSPTTSNRIQPGPGSQAAPPPSPPPQSSQVTDAPQSTISGGTEKPPKSSAATKPPSPGKVTTGPLMAANSFGKLRLGMSAEEAEAAGVTLEKDSATETCAWYRVNSPASASVVISQASGVEQISPSGPVHTPEGIGRGSTEPDVMAAYPGATKEAAYLFTVPTGPVSVYEIYIDGNGRVDTVQLANTNPSCLG